MTQKAHSATATEPRLIIFCAADDREHIEGAVARAALSKAIAVHPSPLLEPGTAIVADQQFIVAAWRRTFGTGPPPWGHCDDCDFDLFADAQARVHARLGHYTVRYP